MNIIIHGFAGAGVIAAVYFVLSFGGMIRNWFANRSETKAALAHDAERAADEHFRDIVAEKVKEILEMKALPAPTPEAK